MNHKQKLGYMALGTGILALGITIGQIVTPDIKAQNNGMFDEIVCSRLTVVNQGEHMIDLISGEDQNMISLSDKAGTPQIALGVHDDWNSIMISNKNNRGIGIWLISEEEKGNQVLLCDPADAAFTKRLALRSHDRHSLVALGRSDSIGVTLFSSDDHMNVVKVEDNGAGAWISVADTMGNIKWSAP